MDEGERRKERNRLDAELEAAGVDLSVLSSIEDSVMRLRRHGRARCPRGQRSNPRGMEAQPLRRHDGPVPDPDMKINPPTKEADHARSPHPNHRVRRPCLR